MNKKLYFCSAAILFVLFICNYKLRNTTILTYFKHVVALNHVQNTTRQTDSSNLSSILETNSSETLTSNKVSLKIDDVLITVKTSANNYKTRIELILKTWFKSANGKVSFISDDANQEYMNKTGGMLFDAHCGKSHGLVDLCCKTDAEFDRYLASPDKKWWCHFDDDQYVNVNRLLMFLDEKHWEKPWYIGRLSRPEWPGSYRGKKYVYKFGTGGAGYCLSQPVLKKMDPWIGKGKFPRTCLDGHAADDVIVGLVAMGLLEVPFTESTLFWAHNKKLGEIPTDELSQQVSLSYKGENVINVDPLNPRFSKKEDPTRLLSFHCYLNPQDCKEH